LFWFYTFPFTKYVRTIIWDKTTSINGFSWRHQHELILFSAMPNTIKVKTGDGDIIKCKSVRVKDRLHPAQKPKELIRKFVLKNSKEDDLVADFFAGSGTTLKVAKEENRRYFGIEYDKTCDKCKKDGYLQRIKIKDVYYIFCAVHTHEVMYKINEMIKEWIK